MQLSPVEGLMLCDYCGGQATPATDEDGVVVLEPTSHKCPACETPTVNAPKLANASIEGHELLYCTQCHGMLFNMEKILPLLRVLREHRYWSRSSQSPRQSDDGRAFHCPLCKQEMDKHPYGGGGNVEVDSCESCEVLWLDRGELSRMASAPDRDPPDYDKKLRDEAAAYNGKD
jgi:Zn-finger nucleic acid-binding protein